MKGLVAVMLKHPLWVLLVFAVCASALGWQARKFEIDASADTLLTQGNELYIRTQVMSERFSPQEFLLVGYQPRNHPLLSQKTLQDLSDLSEQLRQLERVEAVRSIRNVPLLSLMENPMTAGNPGDWTQANKQFSMEQLQETFDGHPIYENLVINDTQTATALQVLFEPNPELEELQRQMTAIQKQRLNGDLSDEQEQELEALKRQAAPIEKQLSEKRLQEIQSIREMLRPFEQDANLYLGGVHVLGYQLIDIIQSDLMIFGSAIAGLICVLLLILFRSPRWVVVTALCCGCSVLMTVGLFGLLGFKATVISANFIALQLILTLAIVIHLIVQYRELAVAHSDWDQRQLVRETFLRKVKPCFYAGFTTAVGFGSLLLTGIQPVITFGWMMIIAMLFSITVSLILFPSLMVLLRREHPQGRQRISSALLKLFTSITKAAPKRTLMASVLFLAAAGAGLFFLNVENSFINYFSESTKAHQELTFIDQELGGSTPLDIVVDIPESQQAGDDLVVQAETVLMLQRIQKMLNEQEGMGKVLSIVNFTELAKQINQGRPLTEYELTAVYRTIDDSLRDELVGSYFSEEHSQLRISARVQDSTVGLNRSELLADIHAGMAAVGVERGNYSLTNLFVLYQDILQRLYRSQIMALGLVYIALTATFCLVFRSIKTGVIGVAPNILSTVSILGIMGWFKIPLDLMTITIASIAMGIAVDDTIHYVDRYRQEAGHADGNAAVRNTNFSVGYAVLYTSIIVMCGFSLLVFSDFVPSAQFGILTSLAMAMALVWNLTLLPVLLNRFLRTPAGG